MCCSLQWLGKLNSSVLGQRRLLFFYESSFARFDPSSESPRNLRAFSDITSVSMQRGFIIVGYANGEADYFYSDREETQDILLARLRPRRS